MKLTPRCGRLLCVLVVAVHGAHFATWSWQPSDGVSGLATLRIEESQLPSRFDSQEPQREGGYRISTASPVVTGTNSAPSTSMFRLWLLDLDLR